MNATEAVKYASVMALTVALPALGASSATASGGRPHVCGNDATDYSVVTEAGVDVTNRGVLVSRDGLKRELACTVVPPPPADAPIIADGIQPLLECSEARAGNDRFHVQVWSGSFMGGTWASISQDRIFPLEPLSLALIPCDREPLP